MEKDGILPHNVSVLVKLVIFDKKFWACTTNSSLPNSPLDYLSNKNQSVESAKRLRYIVKIVNGWNWIN